MSLQLSFLQPSTWVTTINNLKMHEHNLDVAELVPCSADSSSWFYLCVPGPMNLLFLACHLSLLPVSCISEIRQNNSRNARAGQLLGTKAAAVRCIMEQYDPQAVTAIINYTLENGHENTPWSDDSLSSKKCLPGFQCLALPVMNYEWLWNITPRHPSLSVKLSCQVQVECRACLASSWQSQQGEQSPHGSLAS